MQDSTYYSIGASRKYLYKGPYSNISYFSGVLQGTYQRTRYPKRICKPFSRVHTIMQSIQLQSVQAYEVVQYFLLTTVIAHEFAKNLYEVYKLIPLCIRDIFNHKIKYHTKLGSSMTTDIFAWDNRVTTNSVAYIAAVPNMSKDGPVTTLWDSDSFPIRIDNCSTKSISYDLKDFVADTLVDVNDRHVSGFVAGSQTTIEKSGTILWNILDDEGVPRQIIVPNSYYVPGGTSKLLSPQHWAQELEDDYPIPNGTRCLTTKDSVILEWSQRKFIKSVDLNRSGNNVATMWSQPGISKADQVIAHMALNYDNVTFDTEIIEIVEPDPYDETVDYEGLTIENSDIVNMDNPIVIDTEPTHTELTLREDSTNWLNIKDQVQPATSSQSVRRHEQSTQEEDNQLELLRWHDRMGHLSMRKIQLLSAKGLLPSRIAKCRIPICQSCMYGSLTKRAWRTKQDCTYIAPDTTAPGQHVSVDQLESPVPGLIGQLKGKPTLARFRYATVFVDSYSRYSYVHLQQTCNAAETLEAKRCYENHARTNNVIIQHYHADNGRFVENAWQDHIK
jgi:hypothetical protein